MKRPVSYGIQKPEVKHQLYPAPWAEIGRTNWISSMTGSFGIYTFLEPYPMDDRRRCMTSYLLESYSMGHCSSRHCDACREGHNPHTTSFVFHINSLTIGITQLSTKFVAQFRNWRRAGEVSNLVGIYINGHHKCSISQVLACESDHRGINVDIKVHPLWSFLNIIIFGARRSVGLSGKLMTAISSTCSFSQNITTPIHLG